MSFVRSAIAVSLMILTLAPALAKAEDAPLYHVTGATVACADAVSVRSLTDQNEVSRNNQAWYKSTFDTGRCVSVTSKSPWRYVSRDNDVVMMDYAGTVGPPGSYYFMAAQLQDTNGYHPGDVAGAPPPAAGTSPTATTPTSTTPETALAPPAQSASQTPDTAVQPTWGVTNVLLLAVALLLAAVVGFLIGRRGPNKT